MEFFAPATAPFAVALCITFGIAALEAAALVLGFGASSTIDAMLPDFDLSGRDPGVAAEGPGAIGQVLGWLSFGRVPALILLIIFTSAFGLAGFLEQGLLQSIFGFTLHPVEASIPALLVAILATRWLGRLLGRILPKDQSEAVSAQVFVGRIATVIRGEAREGMPAEAKLKDGFGKTHYLLVEPEQAGQVFGAGSQVLIVKQRGGVYRAIVQLQQT